MRSSYTNLIQSKYFNPAFNCAIFDGPVRIYFSQVQEESVLKVYVSIQQNLAQEVDIIKEQAKKTGANILIMAYPCAESFGLSFDENFDQENSSFVIEPWNQDIVIGLRGPLEDHQIESLVENMRLTLNRWSPVESLDNVVSL